MLKTEKTTKNNGVCRRNQDTKRAGDQKSRPLKFSRKNCTFLFGKLYFSFWRLYMSGQSKRKAAKHFALPLSRFYLRRIESANHYSCISSEFACGTDCRFTALSRRNSSSFFGKHFVGFPQNYSAISNCMTTLAEYATGVPGPKMAATPAL